MPNHGRLKLCIISAFTFCLVFCPMYVYYRKFRLGAVLYFFAGDTFYYLDVARTSHKLGFFTFDGVHPTNGFHPLWQYLLTYLARFHQFSFAAIDPPDHIFLLDLLIVSVGFALLAVFAAKQVRRSWLVPLALCPGLTWFVMSVADTNYLSAWSWVNGMESGLSLLCFGMVLLFFGRDMPGGWKLFLGGLALGFAVLARLDDVFFLLVFFAYALWRAPQQKIKTALAFVAPFLMLAAYMLYNHRTVGAYFPLSGATKASFALFANIRYVGQIMYPGSWDPQSFPAAPPYNYSGWSEFAARIFQMWFSILICSAYLAFGYTRRVLEERPVLSCLCAGALAKGLYNLFFVSASAQGSWYYPISIFTCNVVFAVVLDKILERILGEHTPVWPTLRYAAILSLIAVFTWFCFFGLVAHKSAEQSGREIYRVYEHGPRIAQDIRDTGETSYLELQDGIVSFVSGMPSTSAIGLATDTEAMKAKKEGRYFDLMASRGVHIIVAAGPYITMMDTTLKFGTDPGELLGSVRPDEYARYSIVPELHDEDADITIYRIIKK